MMNKFKKGLVLLLFWIRDSRIWLAQKSVEGVFKIFRVTLLASYVKEKNMVNMELVPTYLVRLREQEKAFYDSLASKGDDFTKPQSDETVKNDGGKTDSGTDSVSTT